jgi:dipeptidyl aminopeptidase/acylaminoacyl peptidase
VGPALDIHLLHPARTGPRPMTPDDLWALPRLGAPVEVPGARALVVPVGSCDAERRELRTRLWRVPLDGGGPLALTAPEHSSSDPAPSPDGRTLAFVRRIEGRGQLHVVPLDGGEARALTSFPLGCFDPRWTPDGRALVCVAPLLEGHLSPAATRAELARREHQPPEPLVTESRVFRHWDVWLPGGEVHHLFVVDAATGAARDLTPSLHAWLDRVDAHGRIDLSPDGAEVAFEALAPEPASGALRSAIHVVPLAGGESRCLTSDHPSHDLRPRYSPDGRWLVYGMQRDPGFYADRVRLMRVDRASGAHAEWLGDWDRSPESWAFLPDGSLALTAEHEGRLSLFHWSGAGAPACVVRGGSVAGLATLAEGRLAFTLQSLAAPAEVHTCDADGGHLARLTRFTEPVTAGFATGEVREAWFAGAGGARVQMYLVLPPGHADGARPPLVHVLHGGPHGISADAFHPRWNAQVFAAAGRAVALVNFQGSTSWGQDFAARILGTWGERPREDVMRATDALIEAGLVDGARMAVAGGSYGGYLAVWVAAHSRRFRCVIDHAGVYDTLAQYASDLTQGRERSFGGEPWDGLERIDAHNLARAVRDLLTPTLVLHGDRDFRVPVAQGLECYGVLKAKGVPARLVIFPDEHHWVLKPRNSLRWYQEVLGWLDRWLAPSP